MAEHRTRPISRVKPVTVFSTVAVGAVTASVGLVGPPAAAEPDYPSWSDIEQAKQNEATKQAEIGRLGELLAGLQRSADTAVQASQMADEKWRQAIDARDQAAERERTLGAQADEADAVAEISKMRAGLLAAHLARTAGHDLSSELMFGSGDAAAADGLLRQLGMATKLGEQSQGVYEQALADRNAADALREQAAEAAEQRERLAGVAEQRADDARSAADAALSAVADAEVRSTELYAQLAALKDTTADLERTRAEGLAREAAEEALRRAQEQELAEERARAEAAAEAASPPNSGGGGTPAAPPPAPAPPAARPGPPNSSAVETAIWFARQQLGERYRLGGAGPNVWDCSGLTRAAYASAGIGIGTHSATNQYYTLAGRGKAVSLGSIQRGDLLFWGSGGDYYHVAIYLGGGRILEAPREGVPVREYFIWGSPSAAARPAG
ncbi:NlpC/P60 family protein [Agromyces sp. SYSU K20354]|uniref:C40 family peptidase n=1 Tax=Agromyces cavernae TaxID=2898659 RepID=UPI001E28D880|nr:C40 family peptidase [Agromyces cavernae]MCD2441561.1 NlpC/P60 family protein [Agromyces cavernae]